MFRRSIIKVALHIFASLLLVTLPVHAATSEECAVWPEWNRFRLKFVSEDGRVVDKSIPQQVTTSEGQSYALLFALIANDRPAFDLILRWTENNLANGDLTSVLPAWQWGQLSDGTWGVIDHNAASDADLWIAYSLLEAGRLWNTPRYSALAELLAARILREETAEIPGLGLTLLPAPMGFQPDEKTWRLNPSYSPLQILRRFSTAFPDRGWDSLTRSALSLITLSSPKGFVPEWADFQIGKGFQVDDDPSVNGVGYNAIRVYLWAGMLHRRDPAYSVLLKKLAPMGLRVTRNSGLSRDINSPDGIPVKASSPGFSSALLPFLKSSKLSYTLHLQHQRVIALAPLDKEDNYYDQVLTLFGLGWLEGKYKFDRMGRIIPRWKCTKS